MKKFARVCSYTNQPINEGFYIGEEYVADTKEAKELFMAECEELVSVVVMFHFIALIKIWQQKEHLERVYLEIETPV